MARSLARAFGVRHLPWDRLRRFPCDLLINATSVGLAPDSERSPLPASWIAAPWVYDIVYNPPRTRLLRDALARGHHVVEGLEMFVEQAAAQFLLFTRTEAPIEVLRETALRVLGHEAAPTEAASARPRAAAPARPSRSRTIRTRRGRGRSRRTRHR